MYNDNVEYKNGSYFIMFDFKNLKQYALIILVVFVFLLQQKLIVTPVELEQKHREILEDVDSKYATINQVKDVKTDVQDMKDKIDKIYDKVIGMR